MPSFTFHPKSVCFLPTLKLGKTLGLLGFRDCKESDVAQLHSLGISTAAAQPLLAGVLLPGRQPPYYQEAQATVLSSPGGGKPSLLSSAAAEFSMSSQLYLLTTCASLSCTFWPLHWMPRRRSPETERQLAQPTEIHTVVLSYQFQDRSLLWGDFSPRHEACHSEAQHHSENISH